LPPSPLRGRAQGAWAGAFLLAMIAGPAVGTVATWSLRAPFFLYAGTLVLAGTLGLWTLRHSEFAARQSVRTEPLALRSAFAAQSVKQNQWLAFLARNRLADLNFGDTVGVLYTLLWPATQVAASSSTANARWAPDQLTWV